MVSGCGDVEEKKEEEGRRVVWQRDDAPLRTPVPGCVQGGSSFQSFLWLGN